MYMFIQFHGFMNMYVYCIYMFIHKYICMYIVHTRAWINIFVCTWYIHVYNCKYMYVRSTDTSVQLHNHNSLSIRPYQPCDAGESQLRAGSAPSEQPPSCHQSSQLTDHPGAACHVQTATATGLPHTHCCHAGHPLLLCHRCPLGSLTSCAGCTCREW